MNVRGDFLGPPHGTTTRALIVHDHFFFCFFFFLVKVFMKSHFIYEESPFIIIQSC